MKLQDLIIDFDSVPDDQLEEKGRKAYREHCLNRGRFGVHQCHDRQEVMFHEDRFRHAVYESTAPGQETRHDTPDRIRLKRMRWIGEVVRGNVPGSECWEVLSRLGKGTAWKRLYIVWHERYVVWLEPKGENRWWFSSAYVRNAGLIREYCRDGTKIWWYKAKEKAP